MKKKKKRSSRGFTEGGDAVRIRTPELEKKRSITPAESRWMLSDDTIKGKSPSTMQVFFWNVREKGVARGCRGTRQGARQNSFGGGETRDSSQG